MDHQPSNDGAVVVVDRRYCYDQAVDLKIVKKGFSASGGDFTVSDGHGNLVFKVEGVYWSRRSERIVYDVGHNPLFSMRCKLLSNHDRWKVYRGRSFDEKHLIFSAKRSSIFQFKTNLDVFMAANKKEKVCDFKVNFFENSCTIYKGDSPTIIAQMGRKYTVENVLLGRDTFEITVNQNVDHAFITALIIILYEIKKPRQVCY
ncbi:Protein LURP-one-related 1 [Acorus calamus]|uniref:Protein LURP-one-related 1 n=1 Tax=Acorus calamus TaxID=4465 RepID=A0AAV9EEQ1_ACOCL|nr:Protein LURP-one-related 1 [Acorus calamus]